MLNVTIPKGHYWTSDYANLDPDAVGNCIPIAYGTVTGIVPTCINTTTKRYKFVNHAVQEFTAVRAAGKTLTKDFDYTEYLSLGEIQLLVNEKVTALTNLYFSIEADYSISTSNYLGLKQNESIYGNGPTYQIDALGTWTPRADGYDLQFIVYGKTSYDATEEILVQNTAPSGTADQPLKYEAANTRVGMMFQVDKSAYITKIVVYVTRHGSISTNKIRFKLSWDPSATGNPEAVQIGPYSNWVTIGTSSPSLLMGVPERNENMDIEADIKAPATLMTNVGDIVSDLLTTHLGKSSSILDATALANLKATRTEAIKIFLDEDVKFGTVLGKMEIGQTWKLVPLNDGTYATTVYASGTPANTPTLYEEDLHDFTCTLDVSQIYQKYLIRYDEEPMSGDFKTYESVSDFARLLYSNEETLDVETYLTAAADATTLATRLKAFFEVAREYVQFNVHGWGLDLIPGRDKVKITRSRMIGGAVTDRMYRILRLVKKPASNLVEVTAVLDTQTY